MFQPDGRFGLVDFGCVKRVTFDVVELRDCYDQRIWKKSEAAARQFLTLIYGRGVPYAREREKYCLFWSGGWTLFSRKAPRGTLS